MQSSELDNNSSVRRDETDTIRKSRFIRDRLLFKINIPIAAVLVVGVSIWSYLHIDFQRRMLTNNVIIDAELMRKNIHFSLKYSMMSNSREDIKNIVAYYGSLRDIRSIRVLNKAGEVMFAGEPQQVGVSIHLSDPICQVCHSQTEPMVLPTFQQRIYHEGEDAGEHVIRLVTPIHSESRCSAAPCHYHPPDEKVLGLMDLSFSLRGEAKLVRDIRRNAVIQAVSLFVATFITIFILFYVLIKKPIGKIMADVSSLAEGSSTPNSNAELTDEIGQMSAAIHKMGDDLIQKQIIADNSRCQLMLQKNMYQDLFEGVPCLVTVQDSNYRLLSFNRAFSDRFRAQIGDFCYAAYKNRELPCENCPVRDTLADGLSHVTEEAGYYKDGTKAQWMVTTAPICDADGQVVAAMEMCLDITSRKSLEEEVSKSRQRYLDIFNNITNALFVADKANLHIIDCNSSAEEIYGTTRQELLGRSFSQLFAGNGEEDNRELNHAMDVVRAGGSLDRTKHVTLDGREFFVSLQATPMEFDDREVLLVSTLDITERLKAEQQLNQASKMATLGEMATALAHELNQPLAVIQTSIDLVSRKIQRNENPTRDELERINGLMGTSIERAINIINHMRDFGRKSDTGLVSVSVNEVLRRAFEFFSQQLSLHDIAVEWHLAENQLLIDGQPTRLEQVIINLFTNARDAIKERAARDEGATEKRITIRSCLERDEVVVEFSDTGVGIPARYRDKIFEPFFTTKEVGKGTGPGLSISYGIVKDLGGRIDVTGNDSGGVTFHIRLPAAHE
jgi:histidine kinase